MSRTRYCSLHTAALTAALILGTTNESFAQDPMVEPVPPPDGATPAPSAPLAPPAVETQVPAQPLPPPAVVIVPPPPAFEAPPPVVAPPAGEPGAEAPPAEEAGSWTDGFSIGAFVDAYGALRSDNNEARASDPSMTGQGSPAGYPHEAYVQADGFALAFAGLDAAYSGDKFGATMSLRFGPGVNRFYAGDKGVFGIDNITQAYVTWKPTDKLTLDLGQFSTIYGAEVAESWKNMNYSRGGLYYAMQPFWHTGLRANIAISDAFALNALLVNGVNNAFEDNKSPSLGLQAVVTPGDTLSLALGYLGALNPRDGAEWYFHHFFDVVATVTAGDFKLIANADFNMYRPQGVADSENWWGISVAPGYAFTDYFGAALRAEYLSDSANTIFGMTTDKGGMNAAEDASLVTLTATLDFKPVPGHANLILRPEFRYEQASDYYFLDKDNAGTKGFWTAMIGAVVTSMP